MKRTIREFGKCWCQKNKMMMTSNEGGIQPIPFPCESCKNTGRILIKETIEESDDMKEFIENKLGWKLCEGKCSKEQFVPQFSVNEQF